MASVTTRIRDVKQPYGGYLPKKYFRKEILQDDEELYEEENIHPSLVGLAVDYLTRFRMGESRYSAFKISLTGALAINKESIAEGLLSNVKGLDDRSIISACKLVGFDVCYRSSKKNYKPVEGILPDKKTIMNIRILVNRCLKFWEIYGPIEQSCPTFEGGYTSIIETGDGDFVTKDTIWDFKVSKKDLDSKKTLQILVYYIMGQHSEYEYFKQIKTLGFFNPRLNIVYTCPVASISKEIIEEVEREVIGYGQIDEKESLGVFKVYESNIISRKTEFTVQEICEITHQRKSEVYKDIRIGRLNAYKKGNKYFVSQEDADQYLEKIKLQKKVIVLIFLFMCLISLAFLAFFLS